MNGVDGTYYHWYNGDQSRSNTFWSQLQSTLEFRIVFHSFLLVSDFETRIVASQLISYDAKHTLPH